MPRLSITLSEDVYKQLKKRAKENLRSVSNEIIFELTHTYVPQPLQPLQPDSQPDLQPSLQPPFIPTLKTEKTEKTETRRKIID